MLMLANLMFALQFPGLSLFLDLINIFHFLCQTEFEFFYSYRGTLVVLGIISDSQAASSQAPSLSQTQTQASQVQSLSQTQSTQASQAESFSQMQTQVSQGQSSSQTQTQASQSQATVDTGTSDKETVVVPEKESSSVGG